jgi:hypothetical protein
MRAQERADRCTRRLRRQVRDGTGTRLDTARAGASMRRPVAYCGTDRDGYLWCFLCFFDFLWCLVTCLHGVAILIDELSCLPDCPSSVAAVV